MMAVIFYLLLRRYLNYRVNVIFYSIIYNVLNGEISDLTDWVSVFKFKHFPVIARTNNIYISFLFIRFNDKGCNNIIKRLNIRSCCIHSWNNDWEWKTTSLETRLNKWESLSKVIQEQKNFTKENKSSWVNQTSKWVLPFIGVSTGSEN